jgi:hypothetical protein
MLSWGEGMLRRGRPAAVEGGNSLGDERTAPEHSIIAAAAPGWRTPASVTYASISWCGTRSKTGLTTSTCGAGSLATISLLGHLADAERDSVEGVRVELRQVGREAKGNPVVARRKRGRDRADLAERAAGRSHRVAADDDRRAVAQEHADT